MADSKKGKPSTSDSLDTFEELRDFDAVEPETASAGDARDSGDPFPTTSEVPAEEELVEFDAVTPGAAPEDGPTFDAPMDVEEPKDFDTPLETHVFTMPTEPAHIEDESAPAESMSASADPLPPPANAQQTLDSIRDFSERQSVASPLVQASFPFSLRIDGMLAPEEREKLLDVLNRENMGIREVDLEPQFQAGRVLIPRISEYAAVILIQALRNIQAKIWFSPSDPEYAETRESTPHSATGSADAKIRIWDGERTQAADAVAVSSLSLLPDARRFTVIEVLTASASLKSKAIEAESTSEYQELLESLQGELKRKAFHKGASAVLNYAVSLTSLGMPTHYRVMVSGTAVRSDSEDLPPLS